jgi:hypothetical protein
MVVIFCLASAMMALASADAAGVVTSEGEEAAASDVACVAVGDAEVVTGGMGLIGVVIAPVQPVVRSAAARAAGARALRIVFFNMLLIYQTMWLHDNSVVVYLAQKSVTVSGKTT